MKITVDKGNKEKLINLWQKVFGDDRAYIELIFSEKDNICDVFAVTENGSLCSVLYLLDCSININNAEYEGKYLYAAATEERHRKKGLMAKLINEAQNYCADNGFDFISLVPANEPLYEYYEKFGFESCMRRYKRININDNEYDVSEISGKEYFTERKSRLKNNFNFIGKSIDYAVSCLRYSGYRFYKDSEDCIYLADSDISHAEEVISSDGSFSGVKTEKYGMVYPIENNLKALLKDNTVYMNIALD